MFYKLLNKNLLSAVLTSAIVLGASSKGFAQSAVTLVEGEDLAPVNETAAPISIEIPAVEEKNAPAPLKEEIPLDDSSLLTPPTKAPTKVDGSASAILDDFDDDTDFSLELEAVPSIPAAANDPLAAPTSVPAGAPVEPELPKSEPQFGNSLLSTIDNDLFNQMSDIEKQTTLLTLELRREKLRNELEAVKEQRVRAFEEKMALEEDKRRKQEEWKVEQEAKILREQQALKEKEILLERLKQKKVLNSYMNQMLSQNQKWIAENAQLYKKMREVEEDRRRISDDFKKKLDNLTEVSNNTIQVATNAKANHDRAVANLTEQNVQLKKRLDALILEAKNKEQNPFAGQDGHQGSTVKASETAIDAQIKPIAITKEYAILDISGKGDDLTAKLINKDGQSFQVRPGTILQTGHTVEVISKTHIQFDRNGIKDYLYTSSSASGVEPENIEGAAEPKDTKAKTPQKTTTRKVSRTGGLASSAGVPSLGSGMFVK